MPPPVLLPVHMSSCILFGVEAVIASFALERRSPVISRVHVLRRSLFVDEPFPTGLAIGHIVGAGPGRL